MILSQLFEESADTLQDIPLYSVGKHWCILDYGRDFILDLGDTKLAIGSLKCFTIATLHYFLASSVTLALCALTRAPARRSWQICEKAGIIIQVIPDN